MPGFAYYCFFEGTDKGMVAGAGETGDLAAGEFRPASLCLHGDGSMEELPVSYLGSLDGGASSWPFLSGLGFFVFILRGPKKGEFLAPEQRQRACEHPGALC